MVACSMLQLRYSKPGKEQIAKMQTAGMTDDQIIDHLVQDFGAESISPPGPVRSVVPYLATLRVARDLLVCAGSLAPASRRRPS